MHKTVDNLKLIENEYKDKKFSNIPQIIAVSKTFPIDKILPLIDYGHIHYGENKLQEAVNKWSEVKRKYEKIKLHMVGSCQTNKVKYLIPLFDYLHSLDNLKLAAKISNEQVKKGKKLKIFIQVNIGSESQKSGVEIKNLNNFYEECNKNLDLNIIGLMCIPPINEKSSEYFSKMQNLSEEIGLENLSMGMSDDYLEAAQHGSNFVRIGTKIFGKRF
tara:strand:+ start:252 stop:902 length:651 start_codon:yes stop_codon:yes gene_type:complete